MIPRIELARGQSHQERSAFAVETSARPLRVILDLETIAEGDEREALLDVCDNGVTHASRTADAVRRSRRPTPPKTA